MAAPDEIALVSSWSTDGHCVYGARFLETLALKWPTWVQRFKLFTDTELLEDPEIIAFRDREADDETSSGSARRGCMKWSWKPFSIEKAARLMPLGGWLIWIDGDVEFTKAPTPDFLATVCPPDKDITFLGRPWAYASETGFVAYNLNSPGVRRLIGRMRHHYLSGAFRQLPEWGDAATFDHCRKDAGLRENDLCAGLDPADVQQNGLHVWPHTVLGDFMLHQKGPKRKRAAYGDAV